MEVRGTFPSGDTELKEEMGTGRKAVTLESVNKQGLEPCLYYFKNDTLATAVLYINLERKLSVRLAFKQ